MMRGTEFNPPTIKFEGSTDDSMMDIHPRIDYNGMNEFIPIIIMCAQMCTLFIIVVRWYNVSRVKLPLHVCLFVRVIVIMSPLFHVNLAGDMINLYSQCPPNPQG